MSSNAFQRGRLQSKRKEEKRAPHGALFYARCRPAYFCCLEEEVLPLLEPPRPLELLPELPRLPEKLVEPEEPEEPEEPPTCEPEPKDSEFWLREALSELP